MSGSEFPVAALSRAALIALSDALREAGALPSDFDASTPESVLDGLDASPLISAAKHLAERDDRKALSILAAASGRIDNLAQLAAAGGALGAIATNQDDRSTLKIYVTGNCTLKPLCDMLHVGMLAHGYHADVREGPFDQWANECINPTSDLFEFAPAFVVLYLSSLGLTQAATKVPSDLSEWVGSAIEALLQRSRARVLLILPEPLEEELDPTSSFVPWRAELHGRLRQRLGQNVLLIDPGPFMVEVGRVGWFAPRYWYHAKLPCHPNALIRLGKHLCGTIGACLSRPIKIVACDFDNLLWGGIVGEDGWQNLEMDVHGSGAPFLRLQSRLKDLAAKGTLLVGVSKNNEADVRDVFGRRSEMVLKWDDFTVVKANWMRKSENLLAIAKSLNLDTRHICFLDDSAFEREEVRASLPEVVVPELPTAPEEFVPYLMRTGLFWAPLTTDEDRHRAAYYRREMRDAEQLQGSQSLEDMLKGLAIRLVPSRICDSNLERVTQLVNKTNQFNLTTRRYDFDTLARLAELEPTFAYCYRVSDRLGDSGITGVLIAIPDGTGYRVDTWCLSCRVMGRTIEQGMFAHLAGWLRAHAVPRVTGEYRATPKNIVVANLYPDLGFTRVGEGTGGTALFSLDLARPFVAKSFADLLIGDDLDSAPSSSETA